jgi:sugar-specific transcriptional regulator TrmB
MYTDILSKVDLSKNESKIYETLLLEGESPVGLIAVKSKINRRNVYDSLSRLIEKGLVFEILQKGENRYKPVDPKKLMEIIKEKEAGLATIMPDLEELYNSKPHEEDVYIYRGVEGWKNFMRDILRVGEDVIVIGGKGGWSDTRLGMFLKQFLIDSKLKKIEVKVLYDYEIKEKNHKIVSLLANEHRFLPKDFSSTSAVTVFGDHVVIQSNIKVGEIDDNAACTVIINKSVAASFRTWFEFMWKMSK